MIETLTRERTSTSFTKIWAYLFPVLENVEICVVCDVESCFIGSVDAFKVWSGKCFPHFTRRKTAFFSALILANQNESTSIGFLS